MENNHHAFAGAPSMNTASKGPAYDRQLLLDGAKRNTVLDLTEVQRYGIESWGDPDYVCIYGLRPTDWYGRGIRILGRTAVECTRDALANNIGRDIATVAIELSNRDYRAGLPHLNVAPDQLLIAFIAPPWG